MIPAYYTVKEVADAPSFHKILHKKVKTRKKEKTINANEI